MNRLLPLDAATGWQITLTLLHLSWLGLVVATLAAFANRCLRRSSAARRYHLNLAALLLLCFSLPTTFIVLRAKSGEQKRPLVEHVSQAALPIHLAPVVSPKPTATMATGISAIPAESSKLNGLWQRLRGGSTYVAHAYLLGVLVMLAKLVLSIYAGQRLRRTCQPVTEPGLLSLWRQQAERLGLRFAPAVGWCERIAVPVVLGALRPMVLLPARLVTGLDTDQLAAVLTHELAHIRRYDHLVILVQRLTEAVLFFHPVAWYLSRRIHVERENCCDDLVLATGSDRLVYAQSLLRVAELRLAERFANRPAVSRQQLVLVEADGGNLSQLRSRIARMLGADSEAAVGLTRVALLAGIALVALIAGLFWSSLSTRAETPPNPKAEFIDITPDFATKIELIGVSFNPSENRPWWKPNGALLEASPLDKDAGSMSVYGGSPEQANCREFFVRIHGLPAGNAAVMQFDSAAMAGGSIGMNEGMTIRSAAGPFTNQKTTNVTVAVTSGNWGPWQLVGQTGEPQKLGRLPGEFQQVYNMVRIRSVVPNLAKNETTLILQFDKMFLRETEFVLFAVDRKGARHGSHTVVGRQESTEYVFALSGEQLDHFEYRLRPYLHHVTFKNVSLQPGIGSQVRMTAYHEGAWSKPYIGQPFLRGGVAIFHGRTDPEHESVVRIEGSARPLEWRTGGALGDIEIRVEAAQVPLGSSKLNSGFVVTTKQKGGVGTANVGLTDDKLLVGTFKMRSDTEILSNAGVHTFADVVLPDGKKLPVTVRLEPRER